MMTSLVVTVLAAAALTVASRSSGAQGAAAGDSAAFEHAARALMRRLAGDWVFEWRGQDGAVATGTRTYRLLPDSLRLLRDETSDQSAQSAHGVLWYHPQARRLFYTGVYAPTGNAVLLSGQLAPGDSAVTFDLVPVSKDSVPINRGLVRSRILMPTAGVPTWSRWDGAWVVTFRRR